MRAPPAHRWQKVYPMKIENIREVRIRFSRYISELPKSWSVLITKNGRPCAALVPVTEDTDLEVLALSQNKRFWKLIDTEIEREKKEGLTDLENL
jgi:antitoxin (DNA-binding transcriptional repressor) of toxin-antitoxin stability system